MNGAPSLPTGWTAAIDPSSGRTYYANPHTGASSWEPPPPMAVLPPPPPLPPPSTSTSSDRYPPQYPQHQQYQQQQQQQQQAHLHYPQQPQHISSNSSSSYSGANSNNYPVHRSLQLQSQQGGGGGGGGAQQGYNTATAAHHHNHQTLPSITTNVVNPLHAELIALTVGQMADLCAIRQEAAMAATPEGDSTTTTTTSAEPYTPLNPIVAIPGGTMMKRPTMEAGRLDIRIHSLHDKLRKIDSEEQSSVTT